MNATDNIISKYLHFGGEKNHIDFSTLLVELGKVKNKLQMGSRDYLLLNYVERKLLKGLALTLIHDYIFVIIDEQSKEDFGIKSIPVKRKPKKQTTKQKSKNKNDEDDLGKLRPPKKNLGKIVDEGEVPYKGRADEYWHDKLKVIFTPNNKQIRSGSEIPKSYDYDSLDFLEKHYGLRAVEFGNWLSQQDRKNYLAGLGLALFDLSHVLDINPKDLSLNKKLSVAFGARGRGNALAHFESDTFAINITRYSRPKQGSTQKKGFDRTSLLTAGGGIGSFAHEYGHALDYFGGMYIEKTSSGALSGARSERVQPDKKLMAENSLEGLMEKLLYKIIWKTNSTHTSYYARLKIAKLSDYYFRRNELFARAFETYVHYKMQKKKYKNIFLAENKYDPRYYLSLAEIKKIEKDFDALINAIKKEI